MTEIENMPFYLAIGCTEYMSICIDEETEQHLDVFTMPMSGLFAGSLLAIEPVTRLVLIVKLSDKGVDTADFVGGLPRDLEQAKKMIAELDSGLFAFIVSNNVCLN